MPIWASTRTDECVNCDAEPLPSSFSLPSVMPTVTATLRSEDTACEGVTRSSEKTVPNLDDRFKLLMALGKSRTGVIKDGNYDEKAFFMAAKDVECSNVVVRQDDRFFFYACLKKDATCVERSDRAFTVFDLDGDKEEMEAEFKHFRAFK